VAVEPDGGTLVVLNYASGSIGVQKLAADGSCDGELHLVNLLGSGVDSERQEGPHPHQAVFHDDRLYVVDLGADLVREYDVEPHADAARTLSPARETAVPAGTGPRHAAVLPDGRFAISGELASTVVIGRPGSDLDSWVIAPSTKRTGPAKTRHPRNYPGDIQASTDGRMIYVANRGYDTITTFAVDDTEPRFISEVDAGVAWPQHLLVADGELLVAGWDSSRVMTLSLVDGEPGEAHVLFECPGAAWLIADTHSFPGSS
jgi:6-phosphogluconolactonase